MKKSLTSAPCCATSLSLNLPIAQPPYHSTSTSAVHMIEQTKQRLKSAQAFLFVPGNRDDRIIKSLSTNAHALIIDLEDAIPLSDKETARRTMLSVLPEILSANPSRILVRINAYGSEFFKDDIQLLKKLGVGAIVLPKAESKSQLVEIEKQLNRSISFIPMIESAQGIDQLKDISSHPSVVRLTLGNIDLQANLGMNCSPDELELLPLKFQMVLMSRLFELAPPIDGVTVDFKSVETIAGDVQRSKRIGFSGKLCIHPSQIEPVIQGFMPSLAEVENAKAIVIADSKANGGAVQLNGKMVDRPVVLMAKLVLQQAGIQ